jgi:hypothetical protein
MMNVRSYLELVEGWPKRGRHILACHDKDSICVYQAYRPSIAEFAVRHQQFGGDFSFSRMSWIKPNFLWMMFRSGWATKEGQERILAVHLARRFFDELLRQAVPSTFRSSGLASHQEWEVAVAKSEVRLQWDPDHNPYGHAVERRALQLGLRGGALQRYGRDMMLSVEDITPFVIEQRGNVAYGSRNLMLPDERIYLPEDHAMRVSLGLDSPDEVCHQTDGCAS